MSYNYRAQGDIETAVQSAQWSGYSFEQFVEQARELWVAELEVEARRVRSVNVKEGT